MSKSRQTAKFHRLGITIPLVLILFATAELGLRLPPLDWLGLFPYQVATMRPGRYSPFTPRLRLFSQGAAGELALMANLPPTEARPAIRFTTDEIGFRATPYTQPGGKPRILVIEGDSFTFGAGLSDEQTFPAVLAREIGVNVYNGGRFFTDPERLVELDWLLEQLNGDPVLAVYVLLEPVDLNLDRLNDRGLLDQIGHSLMGEEYGRFKDEMRFLRRRFRLWSAVSPLRILASRADKWICDGHILPNHYEQRVVKRRLPDGDRILLEPKHVRRYLNPPDDVTVRHTADYLDWLRSQLRDRNLDFAVLLVPESASLYGPWLFGESRPGDTHYFDTLEKELARRYIRVINGLEVLRRTAAEDIVRGQLAYYREDHHWNRIGVHRIAREAAARLRGTVLDLANSRQVKVASRSHAF